MAARKSSYRSRTQHAVVLIDYTNVFGVISERIDNDQPDAVVLDLVASLKRHVSDHLKLKPIRTMAFANLPPGHTHGHRATGAWLAAGIEPRFSYARSRDEAAAIELAMEAMDLSAQLGPQTAFVILSGNQWFVPLVQRLCRAGHFVLMSTLESPSEPDDLPADCQDLYLNAEFLLGGPGRKLSLAAKSEDEEEDLPSQRPEQTFPIADEAVRRTLEVIESYFGQYEEIYLTPLLRKLSEVMDDPNEEPKLLISELEQAGAVWLEKRRGFPHNYTVLLMNIEHPDVAEIKEASAESARSFDDEEYDEDFDDQEDDDDGYFEDDDHEPEYADDDDEDEDYTKS